MQNITITTDFTFLAPCGVKECTSEVAILAISVTKLQYSTSFLDLTTEGTQIFQSSNHVQANMSRKRGNICNLNVTAYSVSVEIR